MKLLNRQGEAQATSTLGGQLAQQQGTTATTNTISSLLSRLNA